MNTAFVYKNLYLQMSGNKLQIGRNLIKTNLIKEDKAYNPGS